MQKTTKLQLDNNHIRDLTLDNCSPEPPLAIPTDAGKLAERLQVNGIDLEKISKGIYIFYKN